jgi:fructokinase
MHEPDPMTLPAGPIVVGGECLVDVITDAAGDVREVPGGGPFNTARTIGRLGGRVVFLGCVSRDRLGERLMSELAADGVDLSRVVRTGAPTTIAHATLDPTGAASYRFEIEGTAAPSLGPEDALRALDPVPSAIHVGTLGLVFDPTGASLEHLVDRASAGTLVMLDPNARPSAIPDLAAWRERIRRIAGRADVIRASVDDLLVLDDRSDVLAAGRSLAELGALVLLTDGGRPVRLISVAFPTVLLPLPTGPVVDTVGAGDVFGGAFLAWWLDQGLGRSALRDPGAVTMGVRVALAAAAITCSRAGADPPSRAELGAAWPALTDGRSAAGRRRGYPLGG